ncbi:MAG: 5-formyltetrahydrofolate cyclo-ligase [Thermosphaera sp.]
MSVGCNMEVKKLKQQIRERIWRLLEEKDVATFPKPVYGRIPNFKGAEHATRRILDLKIWRDAEVVKSNPDSPQYFLREAAVRQGKQLLIATPRLRSGFLMIKPNMIDYSKAFKVATIRGAFKYGKIVRLEEIPHVDLIVTGCVAVDSIGRRLGKGGGYSELEYAILRELGVVNESTPIVTTIHDLQFVGQVPLEPHDYTLDYASTPTRLVKFEGEKIRPRGVYWDLLGEKENLEVIKELRRILRR